MADLLPCPFCEHKNIEIYESYENGWSVGCEWCSASVPGYCKKEDAIRVWNDQPARKLQERYKEALEAIINAETGYGRVVECSYCTIMKNIAQDALETGRV